MAQKQIELQDLDLQQLVEVKKQLEDVRSHLLASVQDCALGNCSELVRGRCFPQARARTSMPTMREKKKK